MTNFQMVFRTLCPKTKPNRRKAITARSLSYQPQQQHHTECVCRMMSQCAAAHVGSFFPFKPKRRCTKARSSTTPLACATTSISCSGTSTGAAASTRWTPPVEPSPCCAARGRPSSRSACTMRSSSKVPHRPHLLNEWKRIERHY